MKFSDIEGQERPVGVLKRALANNTLAHAYLFSGEAGVGKRLTALALAAAVNCREAGAEGGCGICPSCRKTAALSHPDVHILASDGDEIKIDQIREIQAGLALKPFEGAKKILIVDGAETLNAASANAFLKTLEEPPGESLIVLVTSMPQSLLVTIRSRCQEIRFLPLARRTLAHVLMRRRGLPEADAWFLAAVARGSIGRGLEMDVEQERTARDEAWSLRSRLERMNPGEILAQAEALSKDRDRLKRLLDIEVEQLRDALVFQETADEALLVNSGGKERCRESAAHMPVPRMIADIELLTASRNLLDRRVSAQLVAENLLITLSRQ